MCVHMFDTARWMLKLGWHKRITSEGGIYVQKEGKSNITDTQTATFEYDGFDAVWEHRTWGSPPDPDYPWALFIYGEKGTLKASTMRADFIPLDDKSKPMHFECLYEREQYPEDVTENDIELNAAPSNGDKHPARCAQSAGWQHRPPDFRQRSWTRLRKQTRRRKSDDRPCGRP